jgi:DNA-binding transcriptional regulator YhcF (GntR family)
MNRWLLMAHDRCDGDELALTQEILAGMIGARRPAVSIVLGNLQKAGSIRIERGRITILQREKMEESACECYRVIREAFDHFIEDHQSSVNGFHGA